MTAGSKLRRRAAQALTFAVGGGIAFTLALGSPASADDVTVQDATVVNAGAAVANSGGNAAVGNTSDNTASTTQTATANGFLGGVASNVAAGGNSSNGSASVTTGSATATGNASTTGVQQSAATGTGGSNVTDQSSTVVNAGAGVANSGGNVAVGNDSTNDATLDQTADAPDGVASNVATFGNNSDGSATIVTGAATATGNASDTRIGQSVTGGSGPGGLNVNSQDADVINAGLGIANSGLNFGFGNVSDNTSDLTQNATGGLVASNIANGGNHSDGHASIITGSATANGNMSHTGIDQSVVHGVGGALDVAVQNHFELNLGLGIANTGLNLAVGNFSVNTLVPVVQNAAGLVASNVNNAVNQSNGTADVHSGSALGTGNAAFTEIRQRLA